MIEADRVTNLGEDPELVHTPSNSGRGQVILALIETYRVSMRGDAR